MSKINEKQELIDNFLNEVEKKLPFWLKGQKEELEDILQELENHIWDRATEQAQGGEPTIIDIQKAIQQMGSPRQIAKEYKRRGSPKYYISEELWPWYWKSLVIVSAIVFVVNVIVMAFGLASGDVGTVIGNLFEGLFTGFLIGLVVITSMFVSLSMEGFLPEDFQKIAEATKAPSKTATTTTTITTETPKISMEQPKKATKEEKKPSYYRGKDYLGEGISGIIGGILLMVLPMIILQEYVTHQFIVWLALLGVLSFITGMIRFTQALIGKNLRLQQLFMVLSIIPSALDIPLFLALINRPAIIQTMLLDFFPNANISLYVAIGVYFIIAGVIISIIVEITRIIRLELEGFPEEKVKTA